MLSIVICSRNPDVYKQLAGNVSQTIGVPYELIIIDNSQGRYGICEAYNAGAARSQYPNLCFSHEDIRFQTNDWGKHVCQWLADTQTGLIGVAGSTVKTKVPSPFWEWQIDEKIFRRNILQHTSDNGQVSHEYTNPGQQLRAEVITLDGVWFCCRREVWETHPFDAKTFREFHFYDLDFSLSVATTYRNYVIYDVLIEHFSVGSINPSFIRNALLFSKKWNNRLPKHTADLTTEEVETIQYRSYSRLIKHLADKNYGLGTELAFLWFVIRSNGLFRRSSLNYVRSFFQLRKTRKHSQ